MRKTITALVLAAAAAIGIVTASLPGAGAASATVRTLPSWAHWKTAPRGACRHGAGVIVWAGHGDGVLVCASGEIETS